MANRALVLDANIVIRAVLGTRVRRILETYAERATFFLPESAYVEAEENLAVLISQRGSDPAKGLTLLSTIVSLVDLVSAEVYGSREEEARERIGRRDPDDWPIIACALTIGCPIWTEDSDFFGCGIATWTSNRVEIFLSD